MNCYVGESEKNISRAFSEAEASGDILIFDEADSFFSDRENANYSLGTKCSKRVFNTNGRIFRHFNLHNEPKTNS